MSLVFSLSFLYCIVQRGGQFFVFADDDDEDDENDENDDPTTVFTNN